LPGGDDPHTEACGLAECISGLFEGLTNHASVVRLTLLEKMSISVVPPVKIDRITGKQTFHQKRNWNISCLQQKVKVVGD